MTLPTALRERYRRALFGHANQYALFLDLALRKAKEGGVVAYVTPTGFLSGEYFKNLRAVLASEAPPVTFDFIGERSGVFDDVLQETLLVCFRRGDRPRAADVRFVETRGSDRLTVRKTGKVAPRSLSEGPWVIPRSPGSAGLARRLLSMSTRLSDWGYRVSTGPLVWNRHKSQLRHRRNGSTVPIIWAEAVSADGEFCFRAARRNHSPYFALKEGDEWLIVRKSCVLLQRTTAKEQPHRLIAAELPESFIEESGGAVTVENHLNMIVSTVSKPPVSTQALAAFLNSTAADRVFRCISGTVAVSAYELESMPLPAAWTMRELDGFLERGEEAKLEAYCERLYGKQ